MSLNIDGTYGCSMISVSGSLSFYNKKSCCDSCDDSSKNVCTTNVESSMCVDTVTVHFDQFATGDTVLLFPGFLMSTNNSVTNPLMIFNSAVPTVGQEALGTPNMTLGGPGIGSAGQAGQPGENNTQQYQTLIISANPPTPLNPVPNPTGGIITLNFYEDVTIREVHLLNVKVPCTQLQSYDFNNNLVDNKYADPLGPNSFQKVVFDDCGACSKTPVRKLVINLKNDVAVCKIIYDQCQNPALPAVTKLCENWDTFASGNINVTFPGGSVTSNNPLLNPAMIFDSTVPTAGQFQLGSPNNMAIPPGAGIGAGGQPGQPGENLVDLSKVLIISDDANPLVPKSSLVGGQLLFTFTEPVLMKEVDFLNVDTIGTTIKLYDASMIPIDFINVPVLGVNSFQKVETTLPYLTKYMTITLTSTTAVSKVCFSLCTCSGGGGLPAPDLVMLPDNATTLVDIPSTGLQGSYSLVVKSVNADGAAAVFSASSGFNMQAGSIARLTSAPSITDEVINIQWLSNNKVQLYHCTLKTGGVGALIPYYVRILTV